MAKKNTTPKDPTTRTRPRILVLEGYSASATNAVRRQGADTVKLSPTAVDQIERALFMDGEFDGLLLTGGGDVDPREYGEKPNKKVYGVSEQRDYCELLALDFAREAGIPVLGICRGSQLMAVHNGGALRQHIEGHRSVVHMHFAEPGSLFRRVIRSQEARFTSLHHQVVKRTGKGWRVAARDKDGTIEAIESRDGRCLGVQFHPELDTGHNEASRRIFRWLVLESAARAGLKEPRVRKAPKAKKAKALTMADFERAGFVTTGNVTRLKPRTPKPTPAKRNRQQLTLHVPDEEARKQARAGRAPVLVSYHCPHCGMRFDHLNDREDHVEWLHGATQIGGRGRAIEPPAGPDDWE
jgi:putative glutamine amidotransferase